MKVHVKSFLAKRGVRPPEEETLEQNRATLSNAGYTVKDPSRKKKEKFAAYGQFAKDKNPHKFFAPPGYEDVAIAQQQQEADDRQRAQDERDSHELAKKEAQLKEEKKKEKKKRGLFGRKKSKKDKDEEEEGMAAGAASAAAATYDPYAAVKSPTGVAPDPYRTNDSSNLNEYNNTIRQPHSRASSVNPDNYSNGHSQSADPYGSSSRMGDPYGSSQSADPYGAPSQNRDPYGAPSQSRDPYGSSTQNRDPYESSSQSSNQYGVSKSASPYGSSQNNDPYGSSAQNRDPYSRSSASNINNSNSMVNDPYSSYTSRNNDDSYSKNQNRNAYDRAPQPDPSTDLNYSNPSTSTRTGPYKENRSPMYSRNNTPDNTNNNGRPLATSTREGRNVGRPSELNNYNSYTVPNVPKQQSNASAPSGGSSNPYAALRNDTYNTTGASSTSNPYGNMPTSNTGTMRKSSNPYGNAAVTAPTSRIKAPLRRTDTNLTTDLNATPSIMGGVTGASISGSSRNPYGRSAALAAGSGAGAAAAVSAIAGSTAGEVDLNDTIDEYAKDDDDLNAVMGQGGQQQQQQQLQEIDDLNATDDQRTQYGMDNYNNGGGYGYDNQQTQMYQDNDLNQEGDMDRGYKTFEDIQREEEQRQQQEEDDAVDELKQQIKFTKQSSVASTRNTLKMAQEAEMSGMNTLGLLGHQSEKLNNVERNLDLMNIQNSIADEKVSELQKLNRSLWAVHVSNPFNSKRRKQEREDKIKNQKIQEQAMMESTNQDLLQSTNRIENAMEENGRNISDVRDRYERKDILNRAQKYQFENDEEDDEMEVEIDRNLDKIQQVSGRLKKLAIAAGSELDSQQDRIKRIEDNTDDLDIKIHVNTTKLSTIK